MVLLAFKKLQLIFLHYPVSSNMFYIFIALLPCCLNHWATPAWILLVCRWPWSGQTLLHPFFSISAVLWVFEKTESFFSPVSCEYLFPSTSLETGSTDEFKPSLCLCDFLLTVALFKNNNNDKKEKVLHIFFLENVHQTWNEWKTPLSYNLNVLTTAWS